MIIRLIVTLLLMVAVAVNTQDDRLPVGDIVLTSYDLTFTPYADIDTFLGTVIITLKVMTPINEIQLHSEDLKITTSFFKIPFAAPTVTPFRQLGDRIILTFPHLIQSGELLLIISYTGKYSKDRGGFYGSASDVLTQFGTTEARRVFPCMDQPDKKAKFKITISHDPNLPSPLHSVYSNVFKNPSTDASKTVFEITKKISTHAVAWAIMVDYMKITTSDIRITVLHRSDPTFRSLFDVTVKLLPDVVRELEIYLDYGLPSEKLEVLAIPNTKLSGMENWGLPIFREMAISFEDGESASDDRQQICQLVTHELAQQWFGDLVTPNWWNEVWLSEGFATYFEYFTLAKVQKDWQMDEQFVVQQTQVALQADWYSGAYTDTHSGKHRVLHPLIIPKVETKLDVDEVFNFDAITLGKGASVVRMLNAILGDVTFKRNLKNYLVSRAEGNVDTAYLWETMGDSLPTGTLPTGVTLAQTMEKWANQIGFPEIVATRDYEAQTVNLTQSQFLLPPHNAVGKPNWNVPIFWITEKDPTIQPALHWLQPDVSSTHEIKLPSVTDEQWLLINKDHAGFYRVNYDLKNWQLLSESYLNLTASSRAMILDDALNLARGDRLDYVTALRVTELLPNETSFAPWSAALTGLGYLYDRLSNDTESREVIENYIQEKLAYIYYSIGGFDIAPEELHVNLLMKQFILHWACRVGHVTCINTAQDLFKSWTFTSTTNPIKPDLRRVSYCTGIQQGGSDDFLRLKVRHRTSKDPDKPRIVYALGCTNDTDLLMEYLLDSINLKTNINGRQVFSAVCQNPSAIQLALKFLVTHWYDASIVWGPTPNVAPPSKEGETEVKKAFSEDLAPKLNTPDQLKQLKLLLSYITLEEVREGVELAIGTLEDTLVWQENHRDEVIRAMGGYRRPPSSAASPISFSVILMVFALFIRLKM